MQTTCPIAFREHKSVSMRPASEAAEDDATATRQQLRLRWQ
jgi:hypothetical protein